MPRFCRAETSTMTVSPPQPSGTRSCSDSCCMTRLGSAFSRSILLMATTIGTSAALAWSSASSVWGITPSSAATTRTTMSVASAPRARMAVNASWPGVSMKVSGLPSLTDLVGADVLGDATGLAGDHVGVADLVEQLGLAVVDVAHDGDDRRADGPGLVGVVVDVVVDVEQLLELDLLLLAGVDEADLGADLGGEQLDHVVGERLGGRDHLALLHEEADHVGRGAVQLGAELLGRGGPLDHDLALGDRGVRAACSCGTSIGWSSSRLRRRRPLRRCGRRRPPGTTGTATAGPPGRPPGPPPGPPPGRPPGPPPGPPPGRGPPPPPPPSGRPPGEPPGRAPGPPRAAGRDRRAAARRRPGGGGMGLPVDETGGRAGGRRDGLARGRHAADGRDGAAGSARRGPSGAAAARGGGRPGRPRAAGAGAGVGGTGGGARRRPALPDEATTRLRGAGAAGARRAALGGRLGRGGLGRGRRGPALGRCRGRRRGRSAGARRGRGGGGGGVSAAAARSLGRGRRSLGGSGLLGLGGRLLGAFSWPASWPAPRAARRGSGPRARPCGGRGRPAARRRSRSGSSRRCRARRRDRASPCW